MIGSSDMGTTARVCVTRRGGTSKGSRALGRTAGSAKKAALWSARRFCRGRPPPLTPVPPDGADDQDDDEARRALRRAALDRHRARRGERARDAGAGACLRRAPRGQGRRRQFSESRPPRRSRPRCGARRGRPGRRDGRAASSPPAAARDARAARRAARGARARAQPRRPLVAPAVPPQQQARYRPTHTGGGGSRARAASSSAAARARAPAGRAPTAASRRGGGGVALARREKRRSSRDRPRAGRAGRVPRPRPARGRRRHRGRPVRELEPAQDGAEWRCAGRAPPRPGAHAVVGGSAAPVAEAPSPRWRRGRALVPARAGPGRPPSRRDGARAGRAAVRAARRARSRVVLVGPLSRREGAKRV